jgi:hypothetical protein
VGRGRGQGGERARCVPYEMRGMREGTESGRGRRAGGREGERARGREGVKLRGV